MKSQSINSSCSGGGSGDLKASTGRSFSLFLSKRASSRSGGAGFTLIEMLVVIAIIGLLIALVTSAVSSALKKGKQANCLSNLRQLSSAATMWSTDHKGRLMPATWYSHLEPYGIEGRDAKVLDCPSETRFLTYEYSINQSLVSGSGGWGPGNVHYYKYANTQYDQIKDPSRLVYFLGGTSYVAGHWWNADRGRRHNGKTNIAWVDGHCSIEPSDYMKVIKEDGGVPYFLQ